MSKGPGTLGALLASPLYLLLSGCLVVSQTPLSPQAPLAQNSFLLGAWVLKDGGETTYLHIGNDGQAGKAFAITTNQDGRVSSESFVFSVTEVEDRHYLSIRLPREDRPRYAVWKAALTGGKTLTLWPADRAFFEDAVKNRAIPGIVERGGLVSYVVLSAEPAALLQFVTRNDGQIFTIPAVEFRRVD